MFCQRIMFIALLLPHLGYSSWQKSSRSSSTSFGKGWSTSYTYKSKPSNGNGECKPAYMESSPFELLNLPQEFQKCKEQLEEAQHKEHPLIGKKTEEIIRFYGYSCKMYNVTTKDGYIITLHRIKKSNGTSVLLWHGAGACSDNWVFNGPTQSLAFILADLGYDVWLGNSRGSSYSLGHTTLSSDDLEYWDFSWHENGIYDLPASIKHIRKKNGKKPIFYVGHSQGTTNFMVGASMNRANKTKPYLSKRNILGAFLLAPAGYLWKNAGSASRIVAPVLLNPTTGNLIRTGFGGRITSRRKLEELSGLYLAKLCSPEAIMCGACSSLMLAFTGFNPPLANYSNIPHLIAKVPNNIPIKSLIHYAQSIGHCTFRQFDYGKEENIQRYGNDTPPDYDLARIKVPTYFYWSQNDTLCPPEDVNRTKNAFNENAVKGFIRVEDDTFSHTDFVVAKNVKELLYDGMIEEMEKLKAKK